MLGVPSNNRRISGSKPSIADPTAARSYFGGPGEANADTTVFREIPNCLAIARPDNRSDRCNRRISAQSSTVITLLIVEEWLTFQPQHVAQYSTAGDKNIKRAGRGYVNHHNYRARILLAATVKSAA
jgi:hypothetical protein